MTKLIVAFRNLANDAENEQNCDSTLPVYLCSVSRNTFYVFQITASVNEPSGSIKCAEFLDQLWTCMASQEGLCSMEKVI